MIGKRMWYVTLCAGALALGACQSAATRIYTVEVTAPSTAPANSLALPQVAALRVDNLSVPAAWDRIEILRPSSAGTLEISDFDHWSAPLRETVRQALSADLSERLPPGIVVFPRLPKPRGALGIDVDILEFSVVDSRASMQASWTITPAAGSPAAKRSEATLQDSMPSAEPSAVAHAWSELIGQLADRIAADVALVQKLN